MHALRAGAAAPVAHARAACLGDSASRLVVCRASSQALPRYATAPHTPPPAPPPPTPGSQGKCCRKRFGWILEHIEPQTRCLFTAEGRPIVDFIGRVENVDEDMQVGGASRLVMVWPEPAVCVSV